MKFLNLFGSNATGMVAFGISAVMSLPAFGADGDGPVLAEGGGAQVTTTDVMSEAQRIPPKNRSEVVGNAATVAELVSNLHMRRVLANEAIKEGLDNDPLVQAQLQIAKDKVLSDARLAAIDKSGQPDEAALTQYAKAAYQAYPKRFVAEQIHARHILVKGNGAESRAKAEAILTELKKGGDFSAIAKSSSDDAGSAAKGGDLGFFTTGRMVKPFEDAAFALAKPGDLSPVVESPFGFHIIELIEKRTPAPRSFAEVEPELKEEAVKQSLKDSRDGVIRRLSGELKLNQSAIEAFAASHN